MGLTSFEDLLKKMLKNLKLLSIKEAEANFEESLGRQLTEEEKFKLLVARRREGLASVSDGGPVSRDKDVFSKRPKPQDDV